MGPGRHQLCLLNQIGTQKVPGEPECVHKVQMKTIDVHTRNDAKYESPKRKNIGKKTKPGTQPWFHTKVTNQRGGAEIRRRREKQQGKDLILG